MAHANGAQAAAAADDHQDDADHHKPDGHSIPNFLTKLLAMINDPATQHIISWNQNGETFKVHNAALLGRDVLPKYYKHGNFTSLVRQLNMYGFHKVLGVQAGGLKSTQDDQSWEFVHPCVQRDRPDLLVFVKRKGGQEAAHVGKKGMDQADRDSILKELVALRQQHSAMAVQFHELASQNRALWQEVSGLRSRHMQQQWKISRIMQFLMRLVSENDPRLSSKRARLALEPGSEFGVPDMSFGADMAAAAAAAPSSDASASPGDASAELPSFLTGLMPGWGLPQGVPVTLAGAPPADMQLAMPSSHDRLDTDLQGIDAGLSAARARLQGHMDPDLLHGLFIPPPAMQQQQQGDEVPLEFDVDIGDAASRKRKADVLEDAGVLYSPIDLHAQDHVFAAATPPPPPQSSPPQ